VVAEVAKQISIHSETENIVVHEDIKIK